MTTVNIPNRLIGARYSLSLRGLRLRTLAFSKLKYGDYMFGPVRPIIITALEWQDAYTDSEQPYRDLKFAVRDFASAYVTFVGDQNKYKFLDKAEYISGKGEVELIFNSDFLKACLSIS